MWYFDCLNEEMRWSKGVGGAEITLGPNRQKKKETEWGGEETYETLEALILLFQEVLLAPQGDNGVE